MSIGRKEYVSMNSINVSGVFLFIFICASVDFNKCHLIYSIPEQGMVKPSTTLSIIQIQRPTLSKFYIIWFHTIKRDLALRNQNHIVYPYHIELYFQDETSSSYR